MPGSESRPHPAPENRRSPKASERLRRLLALVPYLVQHPGVELTLVASLFGLNEHELVADLNLLFVSGLPPYGPGDLIDVDIQDGRVWVRMADYFARPLRPTRNEALALYLRGTALQSAPGLTESPAIASALTKLRERLGPEIGDLGVRVEASGGGPPEEALETVRTAAAEHRRIRIEYYAASTGEITLRDIDPEEVFFDIGNWYVAAWDHLSGEERLFRADRIRTVAETGGSFVPRGLAGAGRPLYTPTERDIQVRLVLAPGARWVAEYYETETEVERDDGALEVVLPASRLEWIARLILRLSGEARVLEPPLLKDQVRELARRTLDQYEQGSPHASLHA